MITCLASILVCKSMLRLYPENVPLHDCRIIRVMNTDITAYNNAQAGEWKSICELLAKEIHRGFSHTESKIWHGSPVWFIEGNPIVGYSVLKNCVRLLFWSGQSFGEKDLQKEGSFKAAEVRYTSKDQVDVQALKGWLKKSETIQWDYKNIVKRQGVLVRLPK